jgi:parvulin-like peptidyl-prolyl isomerase
MKTSKSKPNHFLAALPLIIFLTSCQNLHDSASSESSAIVAKYKGGQVSLKDANLELNLLISKNEKLKGLTFEKLNSEQKEAVIKEVILNQITYKEAKKRNLDQEKDYQEALRIFKSELLKQKLLVTIAKEATDENSLRKNYNELVEKLKNKKDLRISYVAVKTQKEAETLYQRVIKVPRSFASLAKKKSLDRETAKKGGDLGFVLEDGLPADVLIKAKALQKGQISKPFTTNGTWLVIKLDDERAAEILPFEKAKDALANNLAKKATKDFASQSLEKAQINILVK